MHTRARAHQVKKETTTTSSTHAREAFRQIFEPYDASFVPNVVNTIHTTHAAKTQHNTARQMPRKSACCCCYVGVVLISYLCDTVYYDDY